MPFASRHVLLEDAGSLVNQSTALDEDGGTSGGSSGHEALSSSIDLVARPIYTNTSALRGSGQQEGPTFRTRNIVEDALTNSPTGVISGHDHGPTNVFNFDWDNSFEAFHSYASAYDPQGKLMEEFQTQQTPKQDFSVAVPVNAQANDRSELSELGHPDTLRGSFPPAAPLNTILKRKAESAPLSDNSDPAKIAESGLKRREVIGPEMSRQNLASAAGVGSYTEMRMEARPAFGRSNTFAGHSTDDPSLPGSMTSSDQRTALPAARRTASDGGNQGAGRPPGIVRQEQRRTVPEKSPLLPPEKVFPIQIGSELFRLSGASLSSDGQAPSYFSQFFEEQLLHNEDSACGVRTLYIDRDPITFNDISRHLQGYHIQPRDGSHYVKLFADAQFYSLPRLISQLFESEIFIEIGHRHFQIPRDIFSGSGDSPNFFSLGFAVFFTTPGEVFPGLDRNGLLRPPSIVPPSVPNRSAEVFAELLHLLRGYPLHIRNEDHRAELLRDSRYFHLRGLEQKLIPHQISFNLHRSRTEIVIRLEDIRQSGVSFLADPMPADRSPSMGWVQYARPFIDEACHELVLEMGDECTRINIRSMRAQFHGQAKARIASLFQVIANKMNLPSNQPLGLMMMSGGGVAAQPVSPSNTGLSEDQVKIRIDGDAHITLDGEADWMEHPDSDIQLEQDEEDIPSALVQGIANHTRSVIDGVAALASVSTGEAGSVSGRSAAGSSPGGVPPVNVPYQASRPPSTRPSLRKRKRRASLDDFGEWIIRTGQWRLRVQPTAGSTGNMEVVLIAVKLDALSGERGRNTKRSFLNR
ncbi:MAG: hypothetical protein M1827_006718 [Pycnora praestabilis]|nr:MAG: hypothetical protein M1827_006718 [Pycnora praestabilis]